MNGSEKVLSVIIAILVVLCVVMGYQLTQTNEEIGEKEQYLNDLHHKQIKLYDSQIVGYQKVIAKLRTENELLTKKKQRVKVVTIREIDSITRLPFDGKAEFFAREVSKLDSISQNFR